MARLLAAVALLVAAMSARAADYAVSPDHALVYVAAKGGGIDAVDLAYGKVIWTNKTGGQVVGASNKLAFAWAADEKKANVFRLVGLEAKIGRAVLTSDPIEMPEWATTEKGAGRTFAVQARDDGDLAIVAYAVSADDKKDAAVVWVKLDTGKVTPLKGKKKEDFFKPAEKPGEFGPYALAVEPAAKGADKGPTLVVKKDGRQLWTREIGGP
jgi:hypothetical protein